MRKLVLLIAFGFSVFTATYWAQVDKANEVLFVLPLHNAWNHGDALSALESVTTYRTNLENAGRPSGEISAARELEADLTTLLRPDASETDESMEAIKDQIIVLKWSAESFTWHKVWWMFWTSLVLWVLGIVACSRLRFR